MNWTRRAFAQAGLAAVAASALAQRPATPSAGAVADAMRSPFLAPPGGAIGTPIGRLGFQRGYPSREATRLLYDNLDRQRAVQAYLWALPIVSFAQWQNQHETVFRAGDTDLVLYMSFRDKLGLLTANATTPYILSFSDLTRTGPLVIDLPPGATAGGVGDFWQQSLGDYGETGPDRGQGGKYLVLGPGQDDPRAEGYRVLRSSTNNIFNGFRVLSPDPQQGQTLMARYRLYPFARRNDPPTPTRYVRPEGRPWSGTQPRGLAYWMRLHEIIQREPVHERDRFFMAMLRPLGIEKGKALNPDARQRALLEEGALLGEATARVIDFEKRFEDAVIWPGKRWHFALFFDPVERPQYYDPLDERTAWFYEAVTAARAMAVTQPGPGSLYLGINKDRGGEWLDGGRSYRLHVPANAPAEQFWSMTLYDVETRCFIDNPHDRADRSSRDQLAMNRDGSVDLFFGPRAQAGKEANWVPSVAGRGWFAYFRLYSPKQAFFDRSWQLPDIERVG